MAKHIILTNDPSFTAWGWAVLTSDEKILKTGCIKTAPEHKKRRIRAGDDRVRRTTDLVQTLYKIIDLYGVNYILCELPHGSQNASAAVMMGIVVGIVTTIGELLDIPVEYYSEQDAKKALLGKNSATKDETQVAIANHYKLWRAAGTKYIDEAVADALAIHYVAARQSPMLKMMRQ